MNDIPGPVLWMTENINVEKWTVGIDTTSFGCHPEKIEFLLGPVRINGGPASYVIQGFVDRFCSVFNSCRIENTNKINHTAVQRITKQAEPCSGCCKKLRTHFHCDTDCKNRLQDSWALNENFWCPSCPKFLKKKTISNTRS